MAKLTEDLKAYLQVRNVNEFVRLGRQLGARADVYVAFSPRNTVIPSSWQVGSISHQVAPGGFWAHNGRKSFTGQKSDAAARQQALDWAAERYGIPAWTKLTLAGDSTWVPADTYDLVMAELKRQKAAAK